MRQIIFFALLIFAATANAQIRWTAGIPYTTNAPTHTPSATGSLWAIDTATLDLYAYYGGAWNLTGERIQTISGCASPAYTPGKGQSLFVINGCDSLYYYRSGAWAHINAGGTGGGGGATNLSFSETSGVFILNSNTGSDVGFKPGNGIGITRLNDTITISATDVSATNEGSLSVGAGTGSTSLIQSNTSGSNTVTLSAGSNITLSENTTTNTITIDGKNGIYGGDGDIPVGTEATVSTNSTFELDYSTGANALEVKDLEGQTIITGKTSADSIVVGASNILLRTPGQVQISGGNNAGAIRIMEPRGSGTNYTQIQSAAQSANITYTLPTTDGTNGQVLQYTTGGNLQWATPSGGVTDGDKGDITVSASGATWLIDNEAVTNAKLASTAVDSTKIATGAISITDINQSNASPNQVLKWNGTQWAPAPDETASGSGTTDLTFTGTTSPYTLNSSTGTDVTFAQGTGITLSRTNNELTVTAVDQSATNEIQTLTVDSSTVNLVERFAIGISPSGNTIRIDVPQTMDGEVNGTFAATSVDTVRRVWFNRTYSQPDSLAKLQWSSTDETLKLGIGETDLQTVVQIGQETLYPKVTNQTGSIIRKGTPVMVDSVAVVQGDNIRIRPAIGSTLQNVATVMGIAAHDIAASATGYVTWFGYVTEVDEANIAQTGITFAAGNILYLSATEAGKLTNVLPTAPNIKDPIAIVVRRPNSNNLTLLVRPQLTPDIHDVNDISISSPTAGQVLRYNSGGFWENGQVQGAGIANNSIDSTKIAIGAISVTDINQGTATLWQTLKWNGTQWAPAIDSNVTNLTFGQSVSPFTLNSDNGTDVSFASGSGITLSRGGTGNQTLTITATDASTTNEIQTIANTSTATTHVSTLSNSGGSLTLTEGSGITIATTGTTLDGIATITAVDASTTNEIQTIANTSTATTHVSTLSNTGGSLTLTEGSGITIATTGTTLDGIATITAVDASITNEIQNLSLSGQSLGITSGTGVTLPVVGVAAGTGLTASASSGTHTLALTGQALDLHNLSTNGILARVGTDNIEARSIQSGSGITVTNGDGVLGNISIAATDASVSNEGSLSVGAGTSGTSLIQSNTSGSNTVTLEAGSNITLTENTTANTIIIASTGSGGVTDGDKGDIDVTNSGQTWTVDTSAVNNIKLASGSGGIYKGSGTIPSETDALVTDIFSISYDNFFPAIAIQSGTGSVALSDSNFTHKFELTSDSINVSGNRINYNIDTIDISRVNIKIGFPSGGVTDGDKGDITVSASGATWLIDNEAVTNAKLASTAVDSTKIATGAISITDINQSNATNGQVLKFNGTQWAPGTDETASGSGATNLTFSENSSPFKLNSDTGTDVTFAQGAGITMSRTNNELTVTAVDQSATNEGSLTVGAGTATTSLIQSNTSGSTNVTLSAGTGISLSEATNTITLTNSAPDQTVAITGAGINAVTGTYPNFTITGTEVDGSITNEGILGVGAGGANTATITTNTSTGSAVTISGGGILSVTETTGTNGGTITLTATEVDGSVSNEGSLTVGAGTATTSLIQSNTSGSNTITLSAGTGMSISEATNTITLTNSAPDQTVAITGTGITVGGTYPNFTLTAADQSATNELQTLTLDSTISNGIEIFGITIGPSGNKINFQVPQPENGDKGDITVASNGTSWTIDNNAITNVKIADNAIDSNKIADGKVGLNDINSGFATNGQVLKWNGSNWRPGADDAGGVSDGDKGDIDVTNSGQTWTVDTSAVNNLKMASGSGGIYKGSGDIPNATAAKVASAGSFTIDYNDGSDAIKVDDQLNTITLLDGTLSSTLSVEPTQAGITSNGTILNLTEQGVFITGDTIDITGVTTKLGFPGGSGTVTTSGTPTTDRLAKFTGSTVIGNSIISDNGSTIAGMVSSATGAFQVAVGTQGERPGSPLDGYVRFNTTNNALEYYNAGATAWEVPLKSSTATGLETGGRVLISDATTGKATSNSALRFDQTLQSLVIAEASTVVASSSQEKLYLQNGSNNIQLFAEVNGDPATRRGTWTTLRSRGTHASKTLVSANDEIGRFQFGAWDGTDYETSSFIGAIVSGTPANNNIPIDIYFTTGVQVTNRTERMRVTATGNVGIGTSIPNGVLEASESSIGPGTVTNTSGGTTVTGTGTLFTELKVGDNITIGSQTVAITAIASNTSMTTTPIANANTNATYRFSKARLTVLGNGNIGVGVTSPENRLQVAGSFGRKTPVTVAASTYTVLDDDTWIIVNNAGTCTITLPTASAWDGREIIIKTITANTVISSASNVSAIIDPPATVGTAILPATDGAWATLVSDGTRWIIMQRGAP